MVTARKWVDGVQGTPESPGPTVARRYLYRSTQPTTRHKGNVGTYYVEVFDNSTNLIASIHSIGLCRIEKVDFKMEMFAIQKRMTILGDWKSSPSGRHDKRHLTVGMAE